LIGGIALFLDKLIGREKVFRETCSFFAIHLKVKASEHVGELEGRPLRQMHRSFCVQATSHLAYDVKENLSWPGTG